ncbi:MAG: M56 family metallopeptidase [Thermomicrobiales bacterium]
MRHDRISMWRWNRTWTPALVTTAAIGLLAAFPAPLVPVARGFRDLCAQYPVLTLLTYHLEPMPVALLFGLVALAFMSGAVAGTTRLMGTLRFNRRLGQYAAPLPPRLARVGRRLGLNDRLTYVDDPGVAAFCYGFLRPRVAVTAGLLACLAQEELVAVLAHERHHLRRRDPARYLLLHALAAAAFIFPIIPALRQRLEARLELAADRAALSVVPRGALAGALLAVLTSSEAMPIGAAGLSATEARIAHLAGDPALPAIPIRAVVASLGLFAIVVVAAIDLTTSAHLVTMVCPLCVAVT